MKIVAFAKLHSGFEVRNQITLILTGKLPGHVAQLVTCLATDVGLTADPSAQVRSQPGPILSWRLTIAVDLGCKATNKTNKQEKHQSLQISPLMILLIS